MIYKIKYRVEDEMKDSKIEWLGKIPKDWELSKFKFVINEFISGGTPDSSNYNYYTEFDKGIPWVSISDMSNKSIINETKSSLTYLGQRNKNLRVLNKGTLIYSIFATLGKVSELNINATTNQAILGLIHNEFLVYNKYLKYWLINIEKDLKYYSSANTQENLNTSKVKNINFLYQKNLESQQKIANFLDLKISEFDSIISKKELLIEKLEEAKKSLISEIVTGKVEIDGGEIVEREPNEMKDSGVQWLGMIPKDWEVTRIKYVSYLNMGQSPESDGVNQEELGIPFLQGKAEFGIKHPKAINYCTKPKKKAYKGEILISVRAPVGELNFADKEYCIGRGLASIGSKENINFIYYFMLAYKNILRSYATGSIFEAVSIGQIENFKTIKLDLECQFKICSYLNLKTEDLNSIITKAKHQIQKLKQAKQSLISEVVTGKIDLRDWEIEEI